jgi:colanic acid biosynthesis glycosyl transferase WcaI
MSKSGNLIVFPNWVDTTNIYKTEPDLYVLKTLNIPTNKKIFFYSGSIGEKQGLEVLLKIAPKLYLVNKDIFFLISGSGPYKNKLEEIAQSESILNIQFIDLQPNEIFNHLLNFSFAHLIIQKNQAADLLLPSKLTNILAVGGLAIVTASKGTSLYNILVENKMAVVIPPNDDDEICKAILYVCESSINPDIKTNVENFKISALQYASRNLNKINIIDNFINSIQN